MHIHYLHQGRQDILSEHDKPRLVVNKLYLHTPTCITWLLNLAYHPPNAHILSVDITMCAADDYWRYEITSNNFSAMVMGE